MPETKGPEPPPGGLHSRQRPHAPYLNRENARKWRAYAAETGKRRFATDCVVVDAARIEPVSTGKFPANREIYREFR